VVPADIPYREYRCSRNAPLDCDQLQQTLQEFKGAKFCLECGFPTPLAAGQEIKGRKGTYQIKQFMGGRGWGRLYRGVRINDGQPILVKEYLLPSRAFNAEEAQRRKDTFIRVAGLTPADGRVQDFRLLPMVEAIASHQDDRCYLISPVKDPPISLRQYLTKQGAMSPVQVRDLLNQTLQTLQFLHSQKFRRPSGQMDQNITHGNLNLDSVLWSGSAAQFYIYLSDLADWEFLFRPPTVQPLSPARSDLVNLGQIAACLWAGKDLSVEGEFRDEMLPTSDLPLRQFLQRLMGLETPFSSAEEARQVLLQLPRPVDTNQPAGHSQPSIAPPKPWLWWLLGIFLLSLVGAGLWLWLKPKPVNPDDAFASYNQLPYKTFAEYSGIEANEYQYTIEQDGTWNGVMKSTYLSPPLRQSLRQPKPDVQFTEQLLRSEGLMKDPQASAPIQAVQQRKTDFAVSNLSENLPDDLTQTPIAHDGLLVFVPFTKEANSLPIALKGQIRMEDLRRLYTGEIKNWKEIGGGDRQVTLRIPTDPEAVRLFQKIVLQDDPQAIARFWQALPPQALQVTSATLQQNRPESADASIISFGMLSKVWDQCGGYPLALVDDGGFVAQAMVRKRGGQSITPSDNLCDDKPRLNQELFQNDRYPLGYDLVVVYPRENQQLAGSQFVKLLTQTQQGQCALSKVGLVPLQPVPDDCSP
jgi:hypothetical protein